LAAASLKAIKSRGLGTEKSSPGIGALLNVYSLARLVACSLTAA